jgi:hypothetical protein
MSLIINKEIAINILTTVFLIILVVFSVCAQNQTCSESRYVFTEERYNEEIFSDLNLPPHNYGIKGNSLGGAIEVRLYDPLWMGDNINDGFLWGTRIENRNATSFESIGWLASSRNPLFYFDQMMSDSRYFFKTNMAVQVVQRLAAAGALVVGQDAWAAYSVKNELDLFSIAVAIDFGGSTTIEDLEGLNLPGLGVFTQDDIYAKLNLTCANGNRALVEFDSEPVLPNIVLYPNPSDGQFLIDLIMEEAGDVQYQIIDIGGRLISEQVQNFGEGVHSWSVKEQGSLSIGIYTLKISAPTWTESKRIIID